MTEADKPAFTQAFSRLAVAFREKAPDAVQLRVYFDVLKAFDVELVVDAAARLMRQEWFPKVGEWARVARQIELERIEEQKARLRQAAKYAAPLCAACDDTGWIVEGTGAKRCACVSQRRVELLGRVPPPALPPAPSTPPDPQQIADVDAKVEQLAQSKVLVNPDDVDEPRVEKVLHQAAAFRRWRPRRVRREPLDVRLAKVFSRDEPARASGDPE